jgi:lysyl-tRNA synthetase class 2
MRFTEAMFDYLFEALALDKKISIKDKAGNERLIDFSTPWERIDYVAGVQDKSGIDITAYAPGDEATLIADIQKQGHEREGMAEMGLTTLIDYLYKKVLRPTIAGPAFVSNYPKTMQPLARQNDDHPELVEQFQLVVNGREIVKAYSELIDPQIQQANFTEQAAALAQGDEEATSGDDDFVLAMEHGMPPQS